MKINSISSINFGVQYENSLNNILENSLVSVTRKGRQALRPWREAKEALDKVAPAYKLFIFDNKMDKNKEQPIRYSLPDEYYVECGQLYSQNKVLPWRNYTPVTLKKGELLTTEKIKQLIPFFKLLEKIDTLNEQKQSSKRDSQLNCLNKQLNEIQDGVKKRLNLYP